MRTGVIYICQSPSGECYIGQSIDFDRRMNTHLRDSKRIKFIGYNYPFYRDLRKYGNKMTWGILMQNIPENELNHFEKYFILEFDTIYPRGYNLTEGGDKIESRLGSHHSEDTKKKISESRMGHFVSEETKKKLSEIRKGKIHSKNTKRKISNSNTGHIRTKVHRNKLAVLKGSKYFNVYDTKTHELIGMWISQGLCALYLHVDQSSISLCLRGKRKSAKGYIFKYVE